MEGEEVKEKERVLGEREGKGGGVGKNKRKLVKMKQQEEG